MTNLETLKQAARRIRGVDGNEYMQIPLEVWQEVIGDADDERKLQKKQSEALQAWIKRQQTEPDDTPAEWWDEFEAFLRENRFNIPERNLGLDDE